MIGRIFMVFLFEVKARTGVYGRKCIDKDIGLVCVLGAWGQILWGLVLGSSLMAAYELRTD